MEKSLELGDHILVNKMVQGDQIKQGDLVVFRYPPDRRLVFVKRAIGLPGDHIRLIDKQVIRNGHRLVEPYVQHQMLFTDSYRDNFPAGSSSVNLTPAEDMLSRHVEAGEVVVPTGSLFVMGDNRDNSYDSRYWGFIRKEDVIGRPLLVYWSYDAQRHETRWDRTLHTITSAPAAEVEP